MDWLTNIDLNLNLNWPYIAKTSCISIIHNSTGWQRLRTSNCQQKEQLTNRIISRRTIQEGENCNLSFWQRHRFDRVVQAVGRAVKQPKRLNRADEKQWRRRTFVLNIANMIIIHQLRCQMLKEELYNLVIKLLRMLQALHIRSPQRHAAEIEHLLVSACGRHGFCSAQTPLLSLAMDTSSGKEGSAGYLWAFSQSQVSRS